MAISGSVWRGPIATLLCNKYSCPKQFGTWLRLPLLLQINATITFMYASQKKCSSAVRAQVQAPALYLELCTFSLASPARPAHPSSTPHAQSGFALRKLRASPDPALCLGLCTLSAPPTEEQRSAHTKRSSAHEKTTKDQNPPRTALHTNQA